MLSDAIDKTQILTGVKASSTIFFFKPLPLILAYNKIISFVLTSNYLGGR